MNDLDVMKRCKQYIESLANGIDPLSGDPVKDDDIVNNVRISRCLFYASGILQKVIDNGGEVQKEKKKKADRLPFSLTDEQAAQLTPASDSISLSKVIGIINRQIDDKVMNKLQRKTLAEWLRQRDLLTEVIINGKPRFNPTSSGETVGISLIDYITPTGQFIKICVYSPEAQQFIFDNIDSIIAFSAEEKAAENDTPASDE